ncbi:hypothetical protein EDE04_6845 [Streptomyces sp. 2132.2]|nr:hypothetical protein EDE04_6845 [Streptomyces sp. 2132.2]
MCSERPDTAYRSLDTGRVVQRADPDGFAAAGAVSGAAATSS